MKGLFKHVKADKIIKWSLSISAAVLLIELISIILFYFSLPLYIPLFNQMPWGENRLGTKIDFFLPVLIVFIFFLLNFFLLDRLYERMPLVSRIIGITTLLISVLSFIFIIRTLQLIL